MIMIIVIIKEIKVMKLVIILRPRLRQIVLSKTWNVVFNQEKARTSKGIEMVPL